MEFIYLKVGDGVERYVVATIKSWNIKNFEKLKSMENAEFYLITDKSELTFENISNINPRYVFFPHWSWIIPAEIYENFECIVFHMTDLPYGRGGSPLQNLIINGRYNTKISALKVCKELDAGDIYKKYPINISEGNADEIFTRISDAIFSEMIPYIIDNNISPSPQIGEPFCFSRRSPEQSEIPEGLSQRQMYDYVRMLDGEGYPVAYTKYGKGRFEYRNAQFIDGVFSAQVKYVEENI